MKKMWAWHDKKEDKYNYIFGSKLQVKMCSPDYFESAIKNGEGEIVEVKIQQITKRST